MGIIEAVSTGLVSGEMARVVVQEIFDVRIIERERSAPGIRICTHGFEGQGMDRVGLGGVEVHIFFVAVGYEEIIPHPSFGQRRKLCRIEVENHFIS